MVTGNTFCYAGSKTPETFDAANWNCRGLPFSLQFRPGQKSALWAPQNPAESNAFLAECKETDFWIGVKKRRGETTFKNMVTRQDFFQVKFLIFI